MKRIDLADKLVELARKNGADEAEAYVAESSEVEIQIQNENADSVTYKNKGGYGIRALIDGRMGFASCNNLNVDDAENIIKKLIADTNHNSPDENNVLPDRIATDSNDGLERFDEKIKSTPVDDKIDLAITIERAAKKYDQRIHHIGWLMYGDEAIEYAISSTRGVHGEARYSNAFGYALAVAMDKSASGQPDPSTTQTGNGIGVSNYFAKLNPEEIGQKAAQYAIRMLGAEEGRTDELEAVFPPESASHFLDLIADMVSAELVQKKKSILSDKMGQMVASDLITVIDDGRLPEGLATSCVDAEGLPTTTKEIIRNGKLVQLLYDSYTANKDKTVSTGNANRGSYSSRPSISPSNFYIKPGSISRDELLGKVAHGLYITEMTGLHAAVDPVTGQFSIPCKALKIEKGELTTPVSDISMSGNLFDFLKSIDGIADDLSWEIHQHITGTPTIKVKSVKISGR